MDDHDQRDQLIQALYGAALSPQGWDAVLPALAQGLGSVNAHLMVWDPAQPQPLFSRSHGMADTMEAAYAAHYGSIDPRRLHTQRLAAGQWYACQQHFGQAAVNRHAFYQEYLIPGDCRWLLGTRLHTHQGMDIYFGLHRAPQQGPYSDAGIAQAQGLTRHLQGAVALWLATEGLRQQARFGLQALDALELGVLACTAQGRLVHANRPAEAMLRQGWPLGLRDGRLQLAAAARRDGHAWPAALGACSQTRRPQWLRCGQAGGAGQPLCLVTVLSLAGDHLLAAAPGAADLLVLLSHSTHRRQATAEQLMLLFGLTAAEARLARALAAGQSLEDHAEAAGTARSTVRTHLAAVFRKVGVNTQAQLVRVLQLVPAGR